MHFFTKFSAAFFKIYFGNVLQMIFQQNASFTHTNNPLCDSYCKLTTILLQQWHPCLGGLA